MASGDSRLFDLAAFLAAASPENLDYAAKLVTYLQRGYPVWLVRKLTDNVTGWSKLDPQERRARHARALAIVGDALRHGLPSPAEAVPPTRPSQDSEQQTSPAPASPQTAPWQFEASPDDPVAYAEGEKILGAAVTTLRGIGGKRATALKAKGIRTIGDLLAWLPHRYEARFERTTLRGLSQGIGVLVNGTVLVSGPSPLRRFPQAYRMDIRLASGERVSAIWFHATQAQRDFYARHFPSQAPIELAGTLDFFDGRPTFIHPDIGRPGSLERGLLPIYSEIEGVPAKALRQWIREALARAQTVCADPLPGEIRTTYQLIDRNQALRWLHMPERGVHDPTDPTFPPRRRLAFDEFFLLSLGLLIRRRGMSRETAPILTTLPAACDRVTAVLPFKLTSAQQRVLDDIDADFRAGRPAHRLIQGDVGSGKTLVALIAAAAALLDNRQAAFMVPTELLAEQHLKTAERFLSLAGFQIALLTGTTRIRERKALSERLKAGEPILVIGTHALIEPGVGFTRLAVVIIDEQHRFGVSQRIKLAAHAPSGQAPHLLVMTATPIPRSLAMTLYGDLDLSVIDELPPGRQPVETKLVINETDRRALMRRLKRELADGKQAYWVFPLIEESDKIALKDATRAAVLLQNALPHTRVALLHGRMEAADKEAIMRDFAKGAIGVLVATTVIEVGVDVPNATVMVIENAERFGLAQLHQLRGRVGRGSAGSVCFLRVDAGLYGDAAARLSIMTETQDGFRIAEADLEIRGAGDLLGTKQSGLPSLHIANPIRDAQTLAEARAAAERLLQKDPELRAPEHVPIRKLLEAAWAGRLQFATSG